MGQKESIEVMVNPLRVEEPFLLRKERSRTQKKEAGDEAPEDAALGHPKVPIAEGKVRKYRS